MKKIDMPNGYVLDLMVLPHDKMEDFNKFMVEHGRKPDRYFYNEIARVKNEVSSDVLKQHIKNLDAMTQMEGLVNDGHRRKIETVKRILTMDVPGQASTNTKVETQFFGGSSLLLWFLTLAAIWRRRGYVGYPYY